MQNRLIEFWVGIFVLLGLGALAIMAFKVGDVSSSSNQNSYDITANFDNIGGLTAKAPVRIAGVTIGRVTDVAVDEDYTAKVTMAIFPQHSNLPLDSSASILTAGLLGSQYIGIEPGGDEEFMQSGDEVEITQSAIVLEKLIGQFLFNQAEGGSQ